MRSDIQRVSVEQIDIRDTICRISTGSDADRLRQSIRMVGLLQCPILLPKADGFAIVTGFQRIKACRQLDFAEIEARVLAPDTSRLDVARTAIADNAIQRPLNWIEISRAVRLLASVVAGDRELVRQAAKVGLPLNPDLVPRLMALDKLHPAIQAGLVENRIALPMALSLGEYPPETGGALAEAFTGLALSLNKQREVLQMISEVAGREEISVLELLNRPPLADILSDADLDRNRRAGRLRTALKKLRYPTIAATEDRFKRIVKSLRLGPHVKLYPPRDFEGIRYALNLTFADQGELERQIAVIQRIAENLDLKDFIEE